MKYLKLGNTNLTISRICLGCMTYGEPSRGNHAWTLPEESSRPLIKQALDAGINFFDTSNNYSDSSSEEIVGRAPIVSALRSEHLEDAVAAVDLVLKPEEMRLLQAAYIPHSAVGFE